MPEQSTSVNSIHEPSEAVARPQNGVCNHRSPTPRRALDQASESTFNRAAVLPWTELESQLTAPEHGAALAALLEERLASAFWRAREDEAMRCQRELEVCFSLLEVRVQGSGFRPKP
jgi:hypothetical protein